MEGRALGVFGGDDQVFLDGPGDGEVGVIPEDGALGRGQVRLGDFVGEAGLFTQYKEARRKSVR